VPVLSGGNVEPDVVTRQARRGGEAAQLTVKESELLAYFLRHAGEDPLRGGIAAGQG